MQKNSIKSKKELPLYINNAINLFISSLIGILFTIALTFIFSFVLTHSETLSKITNLYFIVSVYSGGLICGFISTKLLSFKGFISGLLSSIPFSLIIVLLIIVISKQSLNLFTYIFIVGIVIICTIGGIISANTKRRK